MHFFTRIPLPQEGCPLQILVWGHGRRCCSHPPPPGPREAARGPKRGRTRLPSSAVYCLGSRGRGPSPQAKSNGTKREKILRRLKSRNVGKCSILVISPSHQVGWNRCCFVYSIEAMSAVLAVKMTWINSNILHDNKYDKSPASGALQFLCFFALGI